MISNPVAANRFLQNGFTVINDIMIKKLMTLMFVVLLDGEELGGL
jgi:hypothetical protein